MDKSFTKLRDYSFNLLARKSYSCFEMERKLKRYAQRRSIEDHHIQTLMEKLKKLKYLDDQKFASNYIDYRLRNNPRGKFLIKRELKVKGVDDNFIERALGEKEINEEEMAEALLQKKQRSWKGVEAKKKREKAYRYLTSRGFRMEIVYKTVNRCYDLGAIE